jgi:hypothetical protein
MFRSAHIASTEGIELQIRLGFKERTITAPGALLDKAPE